MRMRIRVGTLSMEAELNDSPTAREIAAALPITASFNTWGDEIYFGIPVHLGGENAKGVVALGDLGYWPPGHALCIFFGPTPMSHGREIRPASPVNVWGKLLGDPKAFNKVAGGTMIIVERIE